MAFSAQTFVKYERPREDQFVTGFRGAAYFLRLALGTDCRPHNRFLDMEYQGRVANCADSDGNLYFRRHSGGACWNAVAGTSLCSDEAIQQLGQPVSSRFVRPT